MTKALTQSLNRNGRGTSNTFFEEVRNDSRFFMFDGISAEEDDLLQRRANAVERRLFKQRVKDLGKIQADLRFALREQGLVRIRIKAETGFTFQAEAGRRLKARLKTRRTNAEEVLYGCITRAARKVGLKPGIEDVHAHVRGKAVEGFVNVVPFVELTVALDRMLTRWRKSHQHRLKA